MPFSSSSRTASSARRRGTRGVPPDGRQQTGRGFPERPNRVTRGVAHDLPARRVGRVGGDAGQLHRLLVGQRRMPAGVPQQDRVDGRHRTKRVVERQPLDTGRWRRVPLVLMPAATADELAGAGASGRILDQRYDVRPARGAPQIELQRRVADSQEVAVPLDEPRNREAAVEIDDLCLVADVAVELGRAADRHNAVAANRQRVHLWDQIVHGDDGPIPQHQVGVLNWRCGAARRNCNADEGYGRQPKPCRHLAQPHRPKLTAEPGR